MYLNNNYDNIYTKEVKKLFPKKIYTSIYGKSIELLPYGRKVLIQGMFIFSVLMLTMIFTAACYKILKPIYFDILMMLVFALFVYLELKPKKKTDVGKEIIAILRSELEIREKVGLPDEIARIMIMRINETDRFFRENGNCKLSINVLRKINLLFAKINKQIFVNYP